jgi:hypothetical protein
VIGAVPEKPRLAFAHPLADSQGHGSFRTESRAALVHLSAGRADLLVTARSAGARAVLVTDARSRVTEPLLALLRETGAGWVVREADGRVSDALSGRVLERVDGGTSGRAAAPDELSPRFLSPTPDPWVRARFVVARRHRADVGAQLGGDLEELALRFTGAAPVGWGLHEPAGLRWDRSDLTTFARRAMPTATRVVAVGGPDLPLAASVVTHRTTKGVEEITEGLVALGPAGSPEADRAVDDLPSALAALAAGMPLIGVAFADVGSRDLSRRPVAAGPVTPAALLVGAPGVRQLGIDPSDAADRFAAVPVGRPRLPGLVFPFTSLPPSERWSGLRAVLSAIGHDRLSAALGRDTTRLLRLDDGEG